jgi:hypothetical protein
MNSGGLGLIKQTIAELEAKRIHVAPPKVPPNACPSSNGLRQMG